MAVMCATSAVALSACSTPITVTFDSVKPWHDVTASYEKLVYDVNIYDTSEGTLPEKRNRIAGGEMTYELTEGTRTEGSSSYSELIMNFSVTYDKAAGERDAGKTDTVTSRTEFQSDSLVTSKMEKTVTLEDRGDGAENLSYTITADYFDKHEATRTMSGKTDTLSIPNATYYDNELMIYLARATAIANNAATSFYMTNLFDCFVNGEFGTYTMTASGDSVSRDVELGAWINGYVVEPEPAEGEEAPQPSPTGILPCTCVGIIINADRHGPPYYVYYSEKAFKAGDFTHKKVPVKISYAGYTGSKQTRVTEYVLKGLAFEK